MRILITLFFLLSVCHSGLALANSTKPYKQGFMASDSKRSGQLGIKGPFPKDNIKVLAHLENWQMGIQFCRPHSTRKAPIPFKTPNDPRANSPMTTDNWGWMDPKTKIPYALVVSMNQGLAIVNLSDPRNPKPMGVVSFPGFVIPTPENCRNNLVDKLLDHGDIKVFHNHAYLIYEGYWGKKHGPGLMVIDLAGLRDRKSCDPLKPNTCILKLKIKVFHQFKTQDGTIPLSDGHNIAINPDSGFMYITAASTPNDTKAKRPRPLKTYVLKINKHNPMDIQFIASLNMASHDIQTVTYRGPDVEHHNKEIIFVANGYPARPFNETLKIIQITNQKGEYHYKVLSASKYPLAIFGHSVWITPDYHYAIYGDEADEYAPILRWFMQNQSRDIIFDIRDLDNVKVVHQYRSTTKAVDHDHYVKGKLLYNSDFTAGLRVVDLSHLPQKKLKEIAYIDTEPRLNNFERKSKAAKALGELFDKNASELGSWSNYPFFDNGIIVVTDQLNGLFVLRLQSKER